MIWEGVKLEKKPINSINSNTIQCHPVPSPADDVKVHRYQCLVLARFLFLSVVVYFNWLFDIFFVGLRSSGSLPLLAIECNCSCTRSAAAAVATTMATFWPLLAATVCRPTDYVLWAPWLSIPLCLPVQTDGRMAQLKLDCRSKDQLNKIYLFIVESRV